MSLITARGLVAPHTGQVRVTHQDGITREIIAEVLAVSAESAGQTAKLAKALEGKTPLESCENVFRFVRKNIGYVLDPAGKQFIKTPEAVIGTGVSDCKGFAILTNDLLRCLGIRSAFRFVSFSPLSTNVTHVYSVAWPNAGGPLVVLDACLPRFNQEKPYTHHEDHMTQISRVSGIGRARRMRRAETPLAISGFETDEELTLKLARQGAELDRNLAARVQGIGSFAVGQHQAAVQDYTDALHALQAGPVAQVGFLKKLRDRLKKIHQQVSPVAMLKARYSPAAQLRKAVRSKAPRWVRGVVPEPIGYDYFTAPTTDREERRIGFLKKVFKKVTGAVKKAAQATGKAVKTAAQATGKAVTTAAKATGKAVAKGAKVVAKGAVAAGKFALKAATLPMRLLAKGLLEIFLPKMAPMFLYLFITNQSTIASLPAPAARKRKKAVSFARFITNTVGMKEAHFLKVVRNGIQRQLGGTPEQILAKSVKGPISGIGVAPVVAAAVKILPVVFDVLKRIFSVFKKKPKPEETPTADDLPNPEADFETAPAKTVRKVVAHTQRKPASQRGEEPDYYAAEMAQEAVEDATHRAIDNEPADTPIDAPLPDVEPYSEPYSESSEPAYAEAEADVPELEMETEALAGIGNWL
ncbi:transglutaminase-like domain-containing protein [Hymenobacter saemangeumensis]|uniref:transglutaminase-like domain-containing protein n=1 Tax=Hymenobacter saemangeumensis TaxID=1084522 RepID=UPI0031F16BE1